MTKITCSVLYIISSISILYFFIIAGYSGLKTSFLWFWPALSMFCILYALLLRFCPLHSNQHLPDKLAKIMLAGFWLTLSVVLFLEVCMLRASFQKPDDRTEYVIVLGAQVRGDTPSLSLQARIDAAAEYLSAHPQMIAICSGAKGQGENKSEALAIRDGLIRYGIDSSRLILEENSTTTRENLRYCLDLLPSPDTPVAIVTNEFHCYRAGLIARRIGYTNAATLSSNRFLITTPHYFVREIFALVKELLIHSFE